MDRKLFYPGVCFIERRSCPTCPGLFADRPYRACQIAWVSLERQHDQETDGPLAAPGHEAGIALIELDT